MLRSIFLGLAGILSLPQLVVACTTLSVCNADNCLRAVRATSAPQLGSAACSSYFLTTIIPPTTTITAYSTISKTGSALTDITVTSTIYTTLTTPVDETATSVIDVTASTSIEETSTQTISATSTEIIDVAASSTQDVTSTTVEDVTSTSDIDVQATATGFTTIVNTVGVIETTIIDITTIHTDLFSTTITSTYLVTLVDRGLPSTKTIRPSSIPASASACSGSVRYSSACSCIGVTRSTITLPSPSTTITVPYITTQSTITHTQTIATAIFSVTGSTDTILTTVSTETDHVTDSTATIPVTDATVTSITYVSTETDFSTTTTNVETITLSTATLLSTVSTETDIIAASTTTVIVPDSTSIDMVTTATSSSSTTDATIESTVVQTSTSVTTSTVTPTCGNAQPTFALKVVGGAYNGQYLKSVPFSGQNADLATAASSISALSAYTLTGTVLSEYNGNTLGAPSNVAFTYAEFRTAANAANNNDVPFVCTIANGALTCRLGAATQIGICNISGPVVVLTESGYYPSGFGCTNVVLNVIPLCTVP